ARLLLAEVVSGRDRDVPDGRTVLGVSVRRHLSRGAAESDPSFRGPFPGVARRSLGRVDRLRAKRRLRRLSGFAPRRDRLSRADRRRRTRRTLRDRVRQGLQDLALARGTGLAEGAATALLLAADPDRRFGAVGGAQPGVHRALSPTSRRPG